MDDPAAGSGGGGSGPGEDAPSGGHGDDSGAGGGGGGNIPANTPVLMTGRRTPAQKGMCHVQGCNRSLAGLRDYYQRYKICERGGGGAGGRRRRRAAGWQRLAQGHAMAWGRLASGLRPVQGQGTTNSYASTPCALQACAVCQRPS